MKSNKKKRCDGTLKDRSRWCGWGGAESWRSSLEGHGGRENQFSSTGTATERETERLRETEPLISEYCQASTASSRRHRRRCCQLFLFFVYHSSTPDRADQQTSRQNERRLSHCSIRGRGDGRAASPASPSAPGSRSSSAPGLAKRKRMGISGCRGCLWGQRDYRTTVTGLTQGLCLFL